MNVASFPCCSFVIGAVGDVVLAKSDVWKASANNHDRTFVLLTCTYMIMSKAFVTATMITTLSLLVNLALLIIAPRESVVCLVLCVVIAWTNVTWNYFRFGHMTKLVVKSFINQYPLSRCTRFTQWTHLLHSEWWYVLISSVLAGALFLSFALCSDEIDTKEESASILGWSCVLGLVADLALVNSEFREAPGDIHVGRFDLLMYTYPFAGKALRTTTIIIVLLFFATSTPAGSSSLQRLRGPLCHACLGPCNDVIGTG